MCCLVCSFCMKCTLAHWGLCSLTPALILIHSCWFCIVCCSGSGVVSPFDLSFVWCCCLSILSQTVVLSVLLSGFVWVLPRLCYFMFSSAILVFQLRMAIYFSHTVICVYLRCWAANFPLSIWCCLFCQPSSVKIRLFHCLYRCQSSVSIALAVWALCCQISLSFWFCQSDSFLVISLPQSCESIFLSHSILLCQSFSLTFFSVNLVVSLLSVSLCLTLSCFINHFFALSLSLLLPQYVVNVASALCCESFSLTLVLSTPFLTLSLSLLLSHSCSVRTLLSLSQVFCSQSFSATLVVSLVFCSPSSLTLALSIYSVHFRSVTLAFLTMFSQSSSVSRLLSRLFFESVFESWFMLQSFFLTLAPSVLLSDFCSVSCFLSFLFCQCC